MSGIIPRPFIDELLNRTNIVELIDSYVPLKKQGSSFVACCPFHNEKTPSFNVIAKKQFYYCFGCGVSGNAISFAVEYLHQSFPEAIETLAARIGMQVPKEGEVNPKQQKTQTLYQLLGKVAEYYQKQLGSSDKAAMHYLSNRGINEEVIQRFQLGYAPIGWHHLENTFHKNIKELITSGMVIAREDDKSYDRFRHRVMYPIHDKYGRIIGFGGRAIDNEQKPKYMNSPETVIFQKNRELYGLYQILKESDNNETIIVVEGYMDVIALNQFGIKNAVATLGTATSTYHIQTLSKFCKKLIFCFDGDVAGKQAAWRALENTIPHLHTGIDANFIFLPEEHDPDSLVRSEGRDAFLLRLKQSIPLHQFLFTTLSQNINIANPAGKSQLVNNIKPYLLKMQDSPYKLLILDELAQHTRIDTHRLNQFTNNEPQVRVEKNNIITRTPMRIALALLLQNPEIVKNNQMNLSQEIINHLPEGILKQLLHYLIEYEDSTTGSLLEAFRNAKEYKAITQLTAWNHQVPEEALTHEFIDTILFLAKHHQEESIHFLLKKAKTEGLNDEDRLQLQQLLRKKHLREPN